jgi:GNAT superfamily N-acetyltransferase
MSFLAFENTSEQHQAFVQLHKAAWPHLPLLSEVETRFTHDEVSKNARFYERWWLLEQNEKVGHILFFIPWWWQADHSLMFKLIVHPEKEQQGFGTRLLKKLCGEAMAQKCTSIGADVFDLYPHHIHFAEKYGFVAKQSDTCSILKATQDIPEEFQNIYKKVVASGIEIISGETFLRRYKNDWQERWWQAEVNTVKDVPSPFPRKSMTFEQWVERSKIPNFDPHDFVFAVDHNEVVGVSGGVIFPAEPTLAGVRFTGVLNTYRRKGIAKALKYAATRYLLDTGVKQIVTNNEVNNPMLEINKALGFKPSYHCVFYEAEVRQVLAKL